MTPKPRDARRVPVERLEAFIARCLVAVGLPRADAAVVAGLMAEADLIGSDGHGVFRLPRYVKRIQDGGINVRPEIRVERETSAMALVDGDNGMGHLVVRHAARVAMDKAEASGVAWVGIHHGNHAGPAALYAKMPLERDMIGLYLAVGSANHMPPWGGTEMLLSTNPIAVAVPALEEPPIVLDMATSVAAYGKVKTKAQRGEPLPEGWMIGPDGKPLTDSARAHEGFLLPIGGHKGYGLALVFGLLAGTLNGAAFGKDVIDFNADSRAVTNTGQAMVAIRVDAFTEVDRFKRAVDAVIRDMKASPTLPGFDGVRLPGEKSHAERRTRADLGIPVRRALAEKLAALASELDVAGLA